MTKFIMYITMNDDLCGQAFPEFMRRMDILPFKFAGKVIFCNMRIKS